MKLLRLKLNTDFRSLQAGFEVHFLRDFDKAKMWDFMPYCLVGRNGSGKSNILEALAAIFYHIECIYLTNKPEGFDGEGEFNKVHTEGFFAEYCTPNSFELEYFFPVEEGLYNPSLTKKNFGDNKEKYIAHISIEKTKNKSPIVKWLNRHEFADAIEAPIELNRVAAKKFLPEFVLGYSSGENEILSLPFFKMRFIHYDEYEDALRNETGYSQPEGRLVYLDNQYSQAVFLTNYLMQDEAILSPIYQAIGIKAIKQFRIIIRQDVPIAKFRTEENITALRADELEIDNKDVFELTYNLKKRPEVQTSELKAIDKLKQCATSQLFDAENKVLYLDYFIDPDKRNEKGELIEISEMKKAFQGNFEDAFELFRTFQTLLSLNLYEVDIKLKQDLYRSGSLYVNETVPTLPSDKRIMRFKDFTIEKQGTRDDILSKSLSDGEHQYLHALGICLLFKDTNSLFLLDEPETHFNPDWRAKFISTLRDCLAQPRQKNMRELLITSHSPFIISDSHEENVLVFKKDDETRVVTAERPGFNTFGASVNQITIDIFERVDTIGDLANSEITSYETRFKEGENPEILIKEINSRLGDSVEKTILINRIKGFIKD
ncbi:restriction system-associated AAA family ATPase [Algoriphagus halophytocola]|uniref:Restriction system-associated AAA family ATPase n=1 Tax=Algoriphagus halophytocola TaxID=2991499 RepID=A0ABY6MJD0_9BACT|nr:restriction system-associated AAA family ATPase [Algoriphagus sp. TR-M5]UZD22299.1 restriction system-associated AAA family ATPase [Algoriphagus sp. TR-M5]